MLNEDIEGKPKIYRRNIRNIEKLFKLFNIQQAQASEKIS